VQTRWANGKKEADDRESGHQVPLARPGLCLHEVDEGVLDNSFTKQGE
jgi:hypothetical protein